MGNKLDDRSTRRDRFHQKAKREGFLARAVYKLEEIDAKHHVFDGNVTRVLDLGCAPGSWLQYARQQIGERAQLVGVDRGPLERPPPGARIIVGDVMTIDVRGVNGPAQPVQRGREGPLPIDVRGAARGGVNGPAQPVQRGREGPLPIDVAQLLGELPAFDIVLSDMAPDTSGIRSLDQARSEALFEQALEIATRVLAPGGNFVGKLFQGPDFKKLTEAVRARFAIQKTAKPASSRQISIEQYVIGKGFRGEAALAGRAGEGAGPQGRGGGRA